MVYRTSLDPRMRQPGVTRVEAIENIKDAIRMCLEVRAEQGLPTVVDTEEVEVSI